MLRSDISEFSELRARTGMTIDELSETMGFSRRTLYRWENGETPPRKAAVQLLEKIAGDRHDHSGEQPAFTFIDLFAGIGGLRRGFEPLGGKCVFTSEWDRYSQQTYKANYECDHEVAGDITKIALDDIPSHDLLLAGFPCQPFSIAGVSKKNALNRPHGFRDAAQGTLFFNVAEIIDHHRPSAFVLENVKNLVNHDKGRTFEVIYRTLTEELGYQVKFQVINSRSWVPQGRERIYMVGFHKKNAFTFENFQIPNPLEGPKLGTILHDQRNQGYDDKAFLNPKTGRVIEKYTLTKHLWQYLQNYADKHKAAGNGFGFGLVGPDSVTRTLSARYYKDGSEILVEQPGGIPRRLTPRECARLMGFEKPGDKPFVIPVSDTQAYRQFGNAVVVPVVEAIARHMEPFLLEAVAKLESREKERIAG